MNRDHSTNLTRIGARIRRSGLSGIYVAVFVAATLAVLVALMIGHERKATSETDAAGSDPIRREHSTTERPPERAADKASPSSQRDLASPEQLPEAGSLWVSVEPAAVDPADIPRLQGVVKDRVLVRMADIAPSDISVGDRVAVEIPQLGQTFTTVLERVERGPGSTRSAAGSATSPNGEQRIFVLTVGPRSSFAFIDTPLGSYELVANRRLGWLMPTLNMDQHVDYSKPHTYVIERDGRRTWIGDASDLDR